MWQIVLGTGQCNGRHLEKICLGSWNSVKRRYGDQSGMVGALESSDARL